MVLAQAHDPAPPAARGAPPGAMKSAAKPAAGPAKPAAKPATPPSAAAMATSPAAANTVEGEVDGSAGPDILLQQADMGAFMRGVRADYAAGRNAGAWGYVVIDAIVANDPAFANEVVEAMAKAPPPPVLGASFMRPWALAAAGRTVEAKKAMSELRGAAGPIMRSLRALLAEGMGDAPGALAIYSEGPKRLQPPNPATAGTPQFVAAALLFDIERSLALRHAELARASGRAEEARAVLTGLAAAAPDDAYIAERLQKLQKNQDVQKQRTLAQALAVALDDQADLIEQRQSIIGAMRARGAKAPFNPLIASLHQSALLLDPNNGGVRLKEVNHLYQNGYFESALRIAQLGNPDREAKAQLYSSAAQAAMKLGSGDGMAALIEQSLKLDGGPLAKLSAAEVLASADAAPRAMQLIEEAMKSPLPLRQRVFAIMTKSQAQTQIGDITAAIASAREALGADPNNRDAKLFLASTLIRSAPLRPEGLALLRGMLVKSPGDTSLMNNLGYSLVNGHATKEELDEGYKLLKEASRLAPEEPNLLDSMGWAYYQYGDFRNAKRYVDAAIEAYRPFENWELFDHLGDVQWRLGQQDAARDAWRKALKAFPPKPDRADIEGKLASGVKSAAPARREMPEVPFNRPPTPSEI